MNHFSDFVSFGKDPWQNKYHDYLQTQIGNPEGHGL